MMNIERSGGVLTLKQKSLLRGLVCLCAIDSGEKGFLWGRVRLELVLPSNALIRTYVYASDTRSYGENRDFDGYLGGLDAAAGPGVLREIFLPVGASEDFYVDRAGRYIWFMFELLSSGEAPSLRSLRLNIAGDHMLDYLPAIYRQDAFTRRFVSIFDSMFADMEREIEMLPARFDYENAEDEMLSCLAEWVCVDSAGLDDAAIRERIGTAFSDYEDLYTVRGVKRSVKRLVGREPFIIESADVDPNAPDCPDSELYRRIYGDNPYKFFILLEDNTFHNNTERSVFFQKMRNLIPADTEFELILLKRCVQLDWHTYLGINSVVGNYVAAVIDGITTIHYDTTIGAK